MARPRKELPSLTPHQAHFVVEAAAADGKISAGDVNRYVASMHEEISALEERLSRLKNAVVEPVKRVFQREQNTTDTEPTRQQRKKKRKRASNPSMQLQGQYLGYIKQIPTGQRGKYKSIAKKEGREAAVAAMKKALGK